MAKKKDYIGKWGEQLFGGLIMDYFGRDMPYFDPLYTDGVFETLDYYVELVGAPARYHFWVSVKSTNKGYTKVRGQRRLTVQVNREDVDRLVSFPAPTYVVGIYPFHREAYILSVNEPRGPINHLTTAYPLNQANMERLWEEVHGFWEQRDMVLKNSVFTE